MVMGSSQKVAMLAALGASPDELLKTFVPEALDHL
jgi:ABC-type lipoprotein release transport system permease subunit